MKKLVTLLLFLLISATTNILNAQGTISDYKRAAQLYYETTPFVYHSNLSPVWSGDKHLFWYVDYTKEGRIYRLVDADKQSKQLLFDSGKLAHRLSLREKKEVSAKDLYLNNLRWGEADNSVSFVYGNRHWLYLINNDSLIEKGIVEKPQPTPYWGIGDNETNAYDIASPNGEYTAFIRNYNLYIRNNKTHEEKPLSYDGTDSNYYSSYIYWSPDSKKIFCARYRPAMKRYIYFVESSPNDQLQPRLHQREYAKPGDEMPFHSPVIFDVSTGKSFVGAIDLCPQQFSLGSFQWNKDSSGVTMEYNQRGHKVYRVLEMNATTGNIRPLIEESSKTFVNYNRHFRYDTSDGTSIIWMSERDNYNHLYLYDRATAKVKRQITKGAWYVREVQRVDEKNHRIYFSASGMNKGEDPYLVHYYSIQLDGKNLISLTPEEGQHQASYSADMKYMVDTYSTVEKAPVTVLRETTSGKIIMPIEKADITELTNKGWHSPEIFHAPGRDGKTEMWGIIIRPSHFDANKKYPVIEYIYAGPGSAYTPKDFHSFYWNMSNLAELGFIVVQLDAMGTSFRSKSFEDVCYKNLKDCGLPDRIAWIKAAASKYAYMDTARVGIFGASAGGQDAMSAVLNHPEFYKAAYSSCGCHDNRMDKIWWNEQWMGYPVDSTYAASSNVVNAYKLQRPLMLVVGEMDDNVDPSSTYQVVNALIKANKDFELVVIPGSNHTMGGDYGEHKRMDFFVKHLLGVAPPEWSALNKK
jgi:dipeptidyl aminopeptidase/acylaminoacyl peptidase